MPKMQLGHEDRNHEIWSLRAKGVSAREVGRRFGITEQRVGQVVRLIAETMPEGERSEIVKQRRDCLDLVRSLAVEIVEMPAKPSFAPNGKPLLDQDGRPILDNSERLAAMDRVAKLDERLGRLTGTDAPTTSMQAIQVTHRDEAQQAAEAMAAKVRAQDVLARFPTLVQDSV